MAITSAMATSFKNELFEGGHCFNATVTFTGTTTNGSDQITAVSAFTGLAVGMALSGGGIPAGTVIAGFSGTTTVIMSQNASAANTGETITATGDVFKMALIKDAPAGTYDATATNYSGLGTDEVTGTGYTAGGAALTNVSPVESGTTAYMSFSPNPSWTSASFSASGCMIYNTANRLGTTGRACSVHDFGGTQTVNSGTFTVIIPTAAAGTAILRLQ